MIMKVNNDIIKKIIELLSEDDEIKTLLFYANESSGLPSAEQLIKSKYIRDYPVITEANDRFSFISVHHDNTILTDDNIYISTFKVSCGVSLDAWHTTDGDERVLLLADRIEQILTRKKICNSTGEFTLEAINSVYWNAFITGVSLIFQLVEQGDINETVI